MGRPRKEDRLPPQEVRRSWPPPPARVKVDWACAVWYVLMLLTSITFWVAVLRLSLLLFVRSCTTRVL
jgi:hypothetical protein